MAAASMSSARTWPPAGDAALVLSAIEVFRCRLLTTWNSAAAVAAGSGR